MEPRSIPAWYPNHVWSIDTTEVRCWGIWIIHIFIVIDHYSRKAMAVIPLEGQNSGCNINALEDAIEKHGKPKHLISDQASVFKGAAFAELVNKYDIKHRFGAIGKHGSIAVIERINKTLKYEWLNKIAIIKGSIT
jgi:putative transposase